MSDNPVIPERLSLPPERKDYKGYSRRKGRELLDTLTSALRTFEDTFDTLYSIDYTITPDEAKRLSAELTESINWLRRIRDGLTKESRKGSS